MTFAPDSATASPTVVIFDPQHEPAVPVSAEFLRGSGCGVLQADCVGDAIDAVARGGVELLVLTGIDAADHGLTLDQIALSHNRPKVVALLCDAAPAEDLFLRRKVPGSKLVVLAGPGNAYGLLRLIKSLCRA